jgi:membrane protein involved in colicin uptake
MTQVGKGCFGSFGKVCDYSSGSDDITKIRKEAAEEYRKYKSLIKEAGPKAKAEEEEEARRKAAAARRAAAAEEARRATARRAAAAEEARRAAAKAGESFLNKLTKKGGNKSKKNSSVKKIKLTQKKK